MKKVIRYKKILEKVEKKKKDGSIINILAQDHAFTKETLNDQKRLASTIEDIKVQVGLLQSEAPRIEFELSEDMEHNCFKAHCTSWKNGTPKETIIDFSLLNSPEFEELRKLSKSFGITSKTPLIIEDNGSRVEVKNLEEVLQHILSAAKKGYEIQRYKGLGEMNPDQLWETTMNPETRTFLQVKTEDAVGADYIFTVLMGDQVEPRREFIYKHAMDVRNLDI
jgi:DNA gyrase subunit B